MFASPLQAFTVSLEGSTTTTGWPTSNLSVDLDPSCTGSAAVADALGAAVAIWSNIPTSSLVVSVGATRALSGSIATYANSSPTYVGAPLIYCDTSFDSHFNLTAPSNIPGLELAPTFDCAAGSTNCPIQGGLIVLNLDSADSTNVNNLSAPVLAIVVAHELGHALGFGHSADTNALMYFDATLKTQLRLGQDDVNVASFLYPRNEFFGGSKIFGCGSLAANSADLRRGSGGEGGGRSPNASTDHNLFAEFLLLLAACFASSRFVRPMQLIQQKGDSPA